MHKIRSSLKYVSYKQRKQVASDLKSIYTASTVSEAEQALDAFEEKYQDTLPAIAPAWRKDFDRLTVFMAAAYG